MELFGKKSFFAGMATGAVLLCVAAGAYIFIALPSKEDWRKGEVMRYSASEQARLRIDCKLLDIQLNSLVQSTEFRALAQEEASLQEWRNNISPSLKAQIRTISESVRDCSRLYGYGEGGTLNGLSSLKFATIDVFADLSLIDTLFTFELGNKCDESCASRARTIVQGLARKRIAAIVKSE